MRSSALDKLLQQVGCRICRPAFLLRNAPVQPAGVALLSETLQCDSSETLALPQADQAEPPLAENMGGILQERRFGGAAAALTQSSSATDARVMQAVSSILSAPVARSNSKRSRSGSQQLGSRQASYSQTPAQTLPREYRHTRDVIRPLYEVVAGSLAQCS
jgi:hypothetical protein